MAIITPPDIDPAPVPGPQRGDEATFSPRLDAMVVWWETSPAQVKAVADNVAHNAQEALSSATASSGSATASAGSASAAAISATASAGSATASAASATAAAGSATAAAVAAAGLVGTSATSNVVGTGSLTFTTQAGKQFSAGVDMKAVDQSNSANAVYGTVASYSGTTLALTVTGYSGSGTIAAWNLSVVGQRGQQGATGGVTGGNLTGAINEAKGADLASATTPDIWSGAGNYETITGTATITGFTAAPQPGARRRILAGAAFTLTAGANMVIKGVMSGQSYVCAAGDEIDVYAETTTAFRLTINKGDGTAMAGLMGTFQNTILLFGTGTFVAKRTGWHRITLSGGCARGGFAIGTNARATGASGAGFCVGMRFLIAGQSYSYVQGAGAAQLSTSLANTAIAGANGGASSFFGSGIATMVANGGVAGLASLGSTATLTGSVGGTATGGDINVQGGSAGSVSGTSAGSPCAASGGGAVGVQGVGYASGDVVANASNNVASGGAGVGGGSGTATATTSDTATGAGGFGGASPAATNAVSGSGSPNYAGIAAGGAQSTLVNYFFTLMNATAGGANPGAIGSGDRSGAGGAASLTPALSLAAGVFAGGGAIAYRGDFASNMLANSGGLYGGGSGGIAILSNGSAPPFVVPAGYPGLVQIEF